MKKFVVIATLLVAMVMCGFAEDAPKFTVTGEFQSGVRVEADKATGNTIQLYSDEHGEDGIGAYAELNGAYDADVYGVSAQVTFGNTAEMQAGGDPAFNLGNAYGWMKFLDKMVTVKAGLIEETAFDNVGDQGIYFFDKTGVGIIASPIDGLTFGATLGTDPTIATAGEPADLSTVTDSYAFGVNFTNESFIIEAGYTAGKWSSDDFDYDVPAAYVQIGLLSVENLTLEGDALFINTSDFSSNGEFISSETVGYTFGKINPSIICYQDISLSDSSLNLYSFEPEIRYIYNDSFEPYVGGKAELADTENVYSGKIGFTAYATKNAVINVYYELSTGDVANAFQLDFSWYF